MTMHNEPLTPEEHDLARRLARLGPHGEPSPALDARILAAAHDAVAHDQAASRQARTRNARRRWPVAFGVAASLALAVGIAWQLRPLPDAGVESAQAPAAADVRQSRKGAEPAQDAASIRPGGTGAAGVAPKQAPPRHFGDAAPGATRTTTQSAALPSPEETPVVFDDPSPVAAFPSPAQPSAAPPPPAPSAPAPVFTPSSPAAMAADSAAGSVARPREQGAGNSAMRAESRRDETKSAAAQAEAASELDRLETMGTRANRGDQGFVASPLDDQPLDDQPPVSADSVVVQQAWMQRIRDLIAEGRPDDARVSLQEFKRRYPGVALPEDLRKFAQTPTP